MGCGNKQRVYQITTAKVVAPKKLTKPKSLRQDWHCPVCGYTAKRRPPHGHKCSGEQPIAYQEARKAVCESCPDRRGDICLLLKAIYPDRPCRISVGLVNPGWKCPGNRWKRVQWNCQKCGAISFDESGLTKCPECG